MSQTNAFRARRFASARSRQFHREFGYVRSSPRKAGPRGWANWIPTFAGMNGMRPRPPLWANPLAPQFRQRAVLAQHRVAPGQRHLGNRREGLVALRRIVAAAEVIGAFRRVGADHEKIVTA